MTSREKNAVFARMEASCQAQQLKQQLFKEAMEYKAYLIAMGFVVGNFDFKHQEAIFYQYMIRVLMSTARCLKGTICPNWWKKCRR